jgi:hypothetical protein
MPTGQTVTREIIRRIRDILVSAVQNAGAVRKKLAAK